MVPHLAYLAYMREFLLQEGHGALWGTELST
jgi:hypothetical protein